MIFQPLGRWCSRREFPNIRIGDQPKTIRKPLAVRTKPTARRTLRVGGE